MPTRKEILERNQRLLETAENAAAKEIARAYSAARRELVADILDRWTVSGVMTPGQAVRVFRSMGLLEAIDRRLEELEQAHGAILRNVLNATDERALLAVGRELSLLPAALRPDLSAFARINAALIEQFLPQALDDAELVGRSLRITVRRELQNGLIQGEAFPSLVRRVFDVAQPSPFRNGMVSAERGVRRLVITAENAARNAYIGRAQQDIPELKRQAVAVIQGRTTDTCLRVHGQIVGVDEPFELSGEPRFADSMMHPAFHWNCRTAVAAWHPVFERGGLTTSNMERSAQAELRKRRG